MIVNNYFFFDDVALYCTATLSKGYFTGLTKPWLLHDMCRSIQELEAAYKISIRRVS